MPKGISFVKLWSRNLDILKRVSAKWKLKGSSCSIKNTDTYCQAGNQQLMSLSITALDISSSVFLSYSCKKKRC